MVRGRDTLLFAWGLALAACGGLNDGAYVGDARLRIEGAIASLSPGTANLASYAAIRWGPYLFGSPTITSDLDDVAPIAFPAPFALPIYEEPPEGTFIEYRGDPPGAFGAVGWGDIIVFEDVDGDGAYRAPFEDGVDVIRGESPSHGIVWSRGVTDELRAIMRADRWPPMANPEALTEGYHLARYTGDGFLVVEGEDVVIEELPPVPDDGGGL